MFTRYRDILPEHFSGQQYRLFDLPVARAAAYVIFYRRFYLFNGRFRYFVDKGLGAYHHSGDAESALHGS